MPVIHEKLGNQIYSAPSPAVLGQPTISLVGILRQLGAYSANLSRITTETAATIDLLASNRCVGREIDIERVLLILFLK